MIEKKTYAHTRNMKQPKATDQTSLVITLLTAFLSCYLLPSTYILLLRFFCTKKLTLKKQRQKDKTSSFYTSTKLHFPTTVRFKSVPLTLTQLLLNTD